MELEVSESLQAPATVPVGRSARTDRRGWILLRAILKQLFACVLVAALAFVSFQLVTHYILQSVQVVGMSMSPTLHNSQRYVLNRWIFHVRDPQLKDIVVLRDPMDGGYAIKRIVAREGDSVYLKGGEILVNGKRLDEPYLPEGTKTYPNPNYREQFLVCGAGRYFVLGDNRNNSADSRIYGTVSRQNILGLVVP